MYQPWWSASDRSISNSSTSLPFARNWDTCCSFVRLNISRVTKDVVYHMDGERKRGDHLRFHILLKHRISWQGKGWARIGWFYLATTSKWERKESGHTRLWRSRGNRNVSVTYCTPGESSNCRSFSSVQASKDKYRGHTQIQETRRTSASSTQHRLLDEEA